MRRIALVAALAAAGCGHEARLAPADALLPDCAALLRVALQGTVIQSATRVEAGAQRAGELPLPAHCIVRAEVGARSGVGGVRYATHFELRLPQAWNGRFQFMGGGGTDGSVRPAYGSAQGGSRPALADGYAVVSSDFGHQASDPRDASFGLDPQARIDWGYNAIGQVTTRAKALIGAYYGRAPRYSYFAGCSGGGRQALVASQRFAGEFDGVVAGAPILEQHVAQTGSMQILQEFTAIAPRGPDGKPVLSRAFSDGDLKLVQRDVLARCDALDGLVDGMVENTRACNYSPAPLQCAGAKTDSCLSAQQVTALMRVLDGPRNSRGRALYEPYPIDAGVLNWRGPMLGTSATAVPNAARATNTSVKYVFMTPPAPDFDYLKFDFDTDPARLVASGGFTASNATDYRAFRDRGGKVIAYMGVGDGLVNANGVRRWYERLVEANGGLVQTQGFARHFQVPGMGHCAGGPALDQFDPFGALVAWVEQGRAPDMLLARGAAFPGRTRPLCAYPKTARYLGSGSPDAADSFRCE
ncbi:MAG TPA: tannase/feruloyl esterase family alpha/beta hydrolase [Ramlibacter sp.]|nr:tannase/feruloyl esterase family alpha/beta hydrolase [Ramlibacter sp.]